MTGEPTVLVVDDDAQILRALRITLAAHGYRVLTAATGAAALHVAAERRPDVVVLDLGLPDIEGSEVVSRLRAWSAVPIVVLSARTEVPGKIDALDRGADDYVTKPFGIEELLARLRAAMRRAATADDVHPRIEAGDLVIDLQAKVVERAGAQVHLTPTEWDILELLVRHRGRLVSRKQLLAATWGPGDHRETSYLRVYVGQLRRKLEPEPSRPRHLMTEAGLGYRFRTGEDVVVRTSLTNE